MNIKLLCRLPLFFISLLLSRGLLMASPPVTMKLLVVGTSSDDLSYRSISSYLTQLGVPYQAVLLNNVTPDPSGNRLSAVAFNDTATSTGAFQGIILSDSSFTVCTSTCKSLLSATDWSRLKTYASQYSVRVVVYSGWPEPEWGLQPGDSGASYLESNPLKVILTPAGTSIFPYLSPASSISISGKGDAGIWAYKALPTAAANETTTAVLTTGSNVVAVTHTSADGRESLALAMDNDQNLLHSLTFSYGVINWVTKGVFLSSRRIYLYPQIDDLLLGNRLYAPTRPECPNDDSCPTIFATATDLTGLARWQSGLQSDLQFSSFHNTFAYNGIGSTWYPSDDPIFPAISSLSSRFVWLNHTWDHANLDCYTTSGGVCVPATLAESRSELTQNIAVAPRLGIPLVPTDMVTPFNGGLSNPNFVQAAVESGLKNIVFAGKPDFPNTGIVNASNPAIFQIPRPVPDLFDDVSSPQTGVYGSWPDEYNAKYGPGGTQQTYDRRLTYDQVLDIESDKIFMQSMLSYEPYPLAFHISNMSLYDGVHSIYSDLMDLTISKYKKLLTLPVLTLDMTDVAQILKDRASYNASGVIGVHTPGVNVVLTTRGAATIPITGACSQLTCSTYGGQIQDSVVMVGNSSVTLSLTAAQGITPVSVNLTPATVVGGLTTSGAVTLSDVAPAGGTSVALSSGNAAAIVPSSVTVPAGAKTGTFAISTSSVSSAVSATITASYNGVSKSAALGITPAAAVALSSVAVTPASLTGGASATGTVTLSGAAPSGGVTVLLASNNTLATVPASITVTAGSTSADFPIATNPVGSTRSITITGSYNNASKTAGLSLNPSATVALLSVTVSPTSVKSQTTATGLVTISTPAPAGGIAVELWTTGTVAFVPVGVSIGAGSTTGTFNVNTNYTTTTLQDTITAFYNGVSKTAPLTVTP